MSSARPGCGEAIFAPAWEVSDKVLRRRTGERCDHRPRHFQWVWNGEALAG